MKTFSIIITTKDRLDALKITLQKIYYLINREDVECIICNDGSSDDTYSFIKNEYPNIQLIENKTSKGLIYSRNKLLNLTTATYAISLDDDLNFLTESPLELINNYFENNKLCGVVSFRIYWNTSLPISEATTEQSIRTRSYAGGGHAIRMKAWKDIPNYPDWFVFYGEEDFASYHLFKKGWEVHYVPEILVHHRVDLKARKKENDYRLRLRRSFRSGWYLYFLFYPWKLIPRKMIYTLWMQIKNKVLKGDFKAMLAIMQAIGDVIINFPKLMKQNNRLTTKEYETYNLLKPTKLYWNPENENIL
ncbi:MAG: glycosyltransferase family 2 protein [Lutibacter sp.]